MAQGCTVPKEVSYLMAPMDLFCLFETMRLLAFKTPMARTPPRTILLDFCLFKDLVLLFECHFSTVCLSHQPEGRWHNGQYKGQRFLQIPLFCFILTVDVHCTLFIWLFMFTCICWWVCNLEELSWADWTNLIPSETALSGIWMNYLVSCAAVGVNYHYNTAWIIRDQDWREMGKKSSLLQM